MSQVTGSLFQPYLKLLMGALVPLIVFCTPLIGEEIQYTVEILGVEDTELRCRLLDASEAVSLLPHPPATLAALRQRAEGDIPELTLILRSFAYYNARIQLDYRQQGKITEVLFDIDLGQQYPLSSLSIDTGDDLEHLVDPFELELSEDSLLPFAELSLRDLGICFGDPATAESILYAEGALLSRLYQQAYPLASVDKMIVQVDQSTQTVSVIFQVSTGPRLVFGPAVFIGLDSVEEDFLQGRVAWEPGEPFDPCLVEYTRLALEETGIFSMITIENGDLNAEEGSISMLIEVSEAHHRTVGLGLSYSTALGPGFTSEWEQRNFRGRGERVSLTADVNTTIQEGSWIYRVPDFWRRNQHAVLRADLRYLETQGFTERSVTTSALIERFVNQQLEYSYGLQAKYLNVTDSDNDQYSALLKAPIKVRWTSTESRLDPTSGQTYILYLTPTRQLNRTEETYLIGLANAMYYGTLDADCTFVLAHKIALGTILGASRIDIPPPDRFYAGTDTLLRGYNYLSVSPLDDDRDPVGGRSLLAYAGELRIRATENLSWVGFFEIGNVYRGSVPDFDEKMLKSLGLGVRYHTPVGPLRLDVAYPLDRRPGVDDSFQIYVSIGQAF